MPDGWSQRTPVLVSGVYAVRPGAATPVTPTGCDPGVRLLSVTAASLVTRWPPQVGAIAVQGAAPAAGPSRRLCPKTRGLEAAVPGAATEALPVRISSGSLEPAVLLCSSFLVAAVAPIHGPPPVATPAGIGVV